MIFWLAYQGLHPWLLSDAPLGRADIGSGGDEAWPTMLERLNCYFPTAGTPRGRRPPGRPSPGSRSGGHGYTYLALFLANQGRTDDADAMRRLVRPSGRAPHDPWAYAVLEPGAEPEPFRPEAMAAAREAVKLNPYYAFAACQMAWGCCTTGRLTPTTGNAAVDGMRHDPGRRTAAPLEGLGRVQAGLGHCGDAIGNSRRRDCNIHPQSPRLLQYSRVVSCNDMAVG